MVYEQFFADQERFWGWRCIFCGEIVDDVILENRQWLKKELCLTTKKPERLPQEGKETHLYWGITRLDNPQNEK
jgi:hypothetical protein